LPVEMDPAPQGGLNGQNYLVPRLRPVSEFCCVSRPQVLPGLCRAGSGPAGFRVSPGSLTARHTLRNDTCVTPVRASATPHQLVLPGF
jgi:hypothetical protein